MLKLRYSNIQKTKFVLYAFIVRQTYVKNDKSCIILYAYSSIVLEQLQKHPAVAMNTKAK